MFAIASKNGRREFVENDRFSAHQRERRTFVVERDEDRNGVGDGTILLQRIPGKHTVVPGKVTMIVLLAGSRHRQQERHRVELVLVAENVHVGENLLHAADHVLHPRRLLSGRTFLDRQSWIERRLDAAALLANITRDGNIRRTGRPWA